MERVQQFAAAGIPDPCPFAGIPRTLGGVVAEHGLRQHDAIVAAEGDEFGAYGMSVADLPGSGFSRVPQFQAPALPTHREHSQYRIEHRRRSVVVDLPLGINEAVNTFRVDTFLQTAVVNKRHDGRSGQQAEALRQQVRATTHHNTSFDTKSESALIAPSPPPRHVVSAG